MRISSASVNPSVNTRSTQLLEAAGMSEFRTRLAGKLSGGMKQKLGLVCALIHRPKVILLDEPTTGVDPVSRRDFWRILYELIAEGVAILTSTAYLDEAERCHRVALMHQGKLLFCDTPANLKAKMGKGVLSIPAPEPRRVRDELKDTQGISSLMLTGDGVHVVVDDAARRIPEFEARLRRAGIPFDAIQQSRAVDRGFVCRRGERGSGATCLRSPIRSTLWSKPAWSSGSEILSPWTGSILPFTRARSSAFWGRMARANPLRFACSAGCSNPLRAARMVAGFDVSKNPEAVRQNIGYMSQKFSLYNDLTVIENIRLVCRTL